MISVFAYGVLDEQPADVVLLTTAALALTALSLPCLVAWSVREATRFRCVKNLRESGPPPIRKYPS